MVSLQEWLLQKDPIRPTKLPFNDFKPRPYQRDLFNELRAMRYRHFVVVAHRDFGKDFLMFQHVLMEMYLVPATYHYIFQTYANAKNVIWDGITYEGRAILSYVPPELIIGNPNRSELSLRLQTKCGNTSILKFIGSNNYNSLRGPKPRGVIFSESAYLHPGIFEVYKPIIRNNPQAWEVHISTPFGFNHFYDLYTMAKHNPKWFTAKYTVTNTGKLTEEDLNEERRRGTSEDMIQQEYNCSFERGSEGAFYAKYIHQAYLDGRIDDFCWDSSRPVYTAWDLGTANNRIIFFQVKNGEPYVIDSYHESEGGLEQKAKYVLDKPYNRAIDFLPHDGAQRDPLKGQSIAALAKGLGLKPHVIARGSIIERIECTRVNFSKVHIDRKKCVQLIKDLTNYRQRFDRDTLRYTGIPFKDHSCHYADCFGLMMLSLKYITCEEVDYDTIEKAYLKKHYPRQRYASRIPDFRT